MQRGKEGWCGKEGFWVGWSNDGEGEEMVLGIIITWRRDGAEKGDMGGDSKGETNQW
jgi:hypothetical protein